MVQFIHFEGSASPGQCTPSLSLKLTQELLLHATTPSLQHIFLANCSYLFIDAHALLLAGLLAQCFAHVDPGVGEILEHVAAGQRGQQAQQVVEQLQQLPVAGHEEDLVREPESARFTRILAAGTQPERIKKDRIKEWGETGALKIADNGGMTARSFQMQKHTIQS